MLNNNFEFLISSESDIITVRRKVRKFSEEMGFGLTDVTRIVTAASELARNIVLFAGQGFMKCNKLVNEQKTGLELIFGDQGPGIPDIELALTEGYSTRNGLGLGLPGTKRLMDEMEIHSEVNKGTLIKVIKWLR